MYIKLYPEILREAQGKKFCFSIKMYYVDFQKDEF